MDITAREIHRSKYHPCGQALHRYANLLNRNFKAERPNRKWVNDWLFSLVPILAGAVHAELLAFIAQMNLPNRRWKGGSLQNKKTLLFVKMEEILSSTTKQQKKASTMLVVWD